MLRLVHSNIFESLSKELFALMSFGSIVTFAMKH